MKLKKIAFAALAAIVAANTFFAECVLPGSAVCYAERDYKAEAEERKSLPIQSNEIEGWPKGPAIGAKAAILMEMNTHTILYAKNIHEECYPASTTKIMTCLLAMQNCTMDETLTFSHDAIYDVPLDGSRLGGVDEGDTMLLEHALYCVLVLSANDIATAVGEHVAEKLGREKSAAAFADLMNEKAKELGCLNTHFSNCNGLYADDHYTSAYDLALIGSEFFNNELLCKMSSTPSYHFQLKEGDEEDTWITSKNQLYKGKTYEYQYLLGSKTGFVSQSRQTLVSAAEKNGMKLVCVIFTEETPGQYEDTLALFQYGFENFRKVSVNDNETKYKISTVDLFDTENDLFGDSTPLISMENDTYVILPNAADFTDTQSSLTYNEDKDSDIVATISYTYSGVNVGSCNIVFSKTAAPTYDIALNFSASEPMEMSQGNIPDGTAAENDTDVIYVNIRTVLLAAAIIAAVIVLIIAAVSIINSYSFSSRGQSSKRRRKRKRETRAAKRSARRDARRRNRLMNRRKR